MQCKMTTIREKHLAVDKFKPCHACISMPETEPL